MVMLNCQFGRIWEQKGRYAGQTCYLIGDAPSVKWFDFDNLPKHKAITCNMLPMHRQFNKLDVLANVLVVPFWFAPKILRRYRDYLVRSHALSIGYRKIIKDNPSVNFVFNITNLPFIYGRNVNFVGKSADFDRDDLKQFDWFTGGFYALLGMAEYLGFKQAIIIGCDSWALSPARQGHWYESGLNEVMIETDTYIDFKNKVKPSIELRAISINQRKKSIPIIDYLDFTGSSPIYKENKELLDESSFDLLSTVSSYNMQNDTFDSVVKISRN